MDKFINEDGRWNDVVLQNLFSKELIPVIKSVKIYPDMKEDQLELIKQHTGRSIATLSFEAWLDSTGKLGDKEDKLTYNLNIFRKLKLLPKVEMFWWRLCRNALPTNSFLNYRNLLDSNLCPCGCDVEENSEHVAVECKQLIMMVDKLRDWGFYVPVFTSFRNCLKQLDRLSISNRNKAILYCTVVYYSWKRRNQIKLGVQVLSVNYLAANVLTSICHPMKSSILGNWDTNLLLESSNTWHPPPLDWIKINVDATLKETYSAGLGAMVRDDKGRFLAAFGEHLLHWDISTLELQAVLFVRRHIQSWMLHYKGAIFEGDNYNVIEWLQKSVSKLGWPNQVIQLEDSLFLNEFNNVLFHCISRNCNKVADCCATLALEGSFSFDSFDENCIPSPLFDLVKKECNCSV